MRKFFLLFILLFSIQLFLSQNYQWQWAKSGGGVYGSYGAGFTYKDDELVLDIAVDNNNNTYYLVALYSGSPQLDGQPVAHYGSIGNNGARRDLMLFSTDCMGNIRWKRTIGGATYEDSRNFVLDNNGGLYLAISTGNLSGNGAATNVPPRFGDNDILPVITDNAVFSDAMKTAYLLKYNTSDGNLVWRQTLQGEVILDPSYPGVPINNTNSTLGATLIDSQNIIHFIVGLRLGTHLNNTVTVPSNYNVLTGLYKYYVVKYDTSGNMVGSPLLLPMEGVTINTSDRVNFIYDELNNRYYLGGFHIGDLSYNNIPLKKGGFLLAINATTAAELWRREEHFTLSAPTAMQIWAVKKDPVGSDLFLVGNYVRINNESTGFGDYTFPPQSIDGNNGFIMRLSTTNTSSSVLWAKRATGMNPVYPSIFDISLKSLAFNGNEVIFAKSDVYSIWDGFTLSRPVNHLTDPVVMRLSKSTGNVLGFYDVMGSAGANDTFSAVAVDNDGNIMLGGHIEGQLFTLPNDGVPTIVRSGSSKGDFFIAKLATSATCSLSVEEETAEEADLQFYPNPVHEFLTIKSKNKLESYEVYSSVGQTVLRGSLGNTSAQINMSALTAGVYYVKVKTEKAVVTEKFLKK
ncbi:T9SS type A sorting domain-containing protein [Chryseobacterium caseinilyticum]|uniref:T9SS type A sorting domain-containing protein n=1 Tax=Chryseobacterium caseinilyticum TaxID=2771428 RepID=A0ABR8ZGV6_9FLAO|nr:T9SS type A sorting domain-containing protein [Chryseobacterium caseinilyticum]MBD8084510.1 T9SS type A sorting domain-containing protein [Chryseobacterium caseinilyticum]